MTCKMNIKVSYLTITQRLLFIYIASKTQSKHLTLTTNTTPKYS